MFKNLYGDLGGLLQYLYPDKIPTIDYTIQNDGDGPYLSNWAGLEIKPTKEWLQSQITEYQNWKNNESIILDRNKEYPTIGDQLDMLWHSMDQGEIPKATQWFNEIKRIKDKYPKN